MVTVLHKSLRIGLTRACPHLLVGSNAERASQRRVRDCGSRPTRVEHPDAELASIGALREPGCWPARTSRWGRSPAQPFRRCPTALRSAAMRRMVRTSGGSVKVSTTAPAIRTSTCCGADSALHRLVELEPEFGRPLGIAERQAPCAAGPLPFPPQGLAASRGRASPLRRPRTTDDGSGRMSSVATGYDRVAACLAPPAAAARPTAGE